MNRTYRIVLNRGTGQWQVASEHARGRGKGRARRLALAAALTAACGTPVSQALAGAAVTGDVTPVVNWGDANDLVVGDTASGSLQIAPGDARAQRQRLAGADDGRGGDGEGLGPGRVLGHEWQPGHRRQRQRHADVGQLRCGLGGYEWPGAGRAGPQPGAAGVINIGSAPGSVATDTAGWVDASEIRFGAGAGALNFNSVGPVIFTPALNSLGAGRHELNHYAGSTQLQGDNSRFAGNTTVSGGSLVVLNILGTAQGRIDAGVVPGATARVSVFNPGSTWALTDNLFVGGGGPGELSIFNSGTVSNQFATVDAQRNDTASVAISDAGSRWVNRAALLVGSEGGRGAVTILAGAT
ncbi:ESPR-type extended signal peptide-containing protein [Achromobacter xylosoxidans]